MKTSLLAAVMMITALPAYAEIMAHDVTARLGIGDRPGVMFASLHNKGAATSVISAQSPSFERIELHTHQHSDNGMMRMVKVESFKIAANGLLKLQPGGDHLMLFGYRGEVGDEITVTLNFADGRTVDLSATTQARQKSRHQMKMKNKMEDHSGHHGH